MDTRTANVAAKTNRLRLEEKINSKRHSTPVGDLFFFKLYFLSHISELHMMMILLFKQYTACIPSLIFWPQSLTSMQKLLKTSIFIQMLLKESSPVALCQTKRFSK